MFVASAAELAVVRMPPLQGVGAAALTAKKPSNGHKNLRRFSIQHDHGAMRFTKWGNRYQRAVYGAASRTFRMMPGSRSVWKK
mmetsp:Transcript_24455/g.39135  ORF Transcript_24455/g.39135 Transcript_24455/m.39135 type:complete len:83 (+) Transcript_24455:285-533(+)